MSKGDRDRERRAIGERARIILVLGFHTMKQLLPCVLILLRIVLSLKRLKKGGIYTCQIDSLP